MICVGMGLVVMRKESLPPLGSVENMRRLARLFGGGELTEGDLGKLISGVALDVEELCSPLLGWEVLEGSDDGETLLVFRFAGGVKRG